MEDLLQQVGALLRPSSLSDIFIYIIFFLSLIASFVIPEKNVQAPYMMYTVILGCIIDLLRGSGGEGLSSIAGLRIAGESILSDFGFLTFIIHIIMFVFPIIAAGLTRRFGQRAGALAVPLCLLAGLFGGIYALLSFAAPDVVYSAIF